MSKAMAIDFHAHVLPGADHGCKDFCETYKQLTQAKEAGVDVVVATPHFYPHRETLELFNRRRSVAYAQLNEQVDRGMFPAVRLGAEVLVCRGMERMQDIESLCISDTRVILLEMPYGTWTKEIIDTVLEIHDSLGLTVVLAHVDRYDEDKIQMLLDYGIYGQINANALCKLIIKKRFKRWVKDGSIVALGSDIHGVKQGYQEFSKTRNIHKESFDLIMDRTKALLEY